MSTPSYEIHIGGEPVELKGWAAIDSLAEDQKARTLKDQLDAASLYRQCFSSDAGRFVLTDLMEQFLKQDIIRADDAPGSPLPGIRQGQAHIVKRIFYMIEFANTGGGKLTGSGVIREE